MGPNKRLHLRISAKRFEEALEILGETQLGIVFLDNAMQGVEKLK
jgi:hypothetical protein